MYTIYIHVNSFKFLMCIDVYYFSRIWLRTSIPVCGISYLQEKPTTKPYKVFIKCS